jgi:ABC-type sugar transport system substrate-binding protein
MTTQRTAQMTKHRRRAFIALPLAALALAAAAAPASAAGVETLPCSQYSAGEGSMPIMGAGFSPNGLVTLSTTTPSDPNPDLWDWRQ